MFAAKDGLILPAIEDINRRKPADRAVDSLRYFFGFKNGLKSALPVVLSAEETDERNTVHIVTGKSQISRRGKRQPI